MRLTEVSAASPLCPQVLFFFSLLDYTPVKFFSSLPLRPALQPSTVPIPYYAIKQDTIPWLFTLKDILLENTENPSGNSVVSYYSSVFHRTFDSNFFKEPAISILILLLFFLFTNNVSGQAAGNRANR
jgi:hypothetical protein